MSHLEDAFYEVCSEATPPERMYVSLYCRSQAYGGPEEGGWWRTIVTLEASQYCQTREQAEAILKEVRRVAIRATADAKAAHGDMCNRQLESCDWDSEAAQSTYGEVDGPDEYSVCVEERGGSKEYAQPAGYC
jgi:hypothetical protein